MSTSAAPAGDRPDPTRAARARRLRQGAARCLAVLVGALAVLPAGAGAAGFTPVTQGASVAGGFDAGPKLATAPDGTAFAAYVRPGAPATALVAVRAPGGTWQTQDLGATTPSTGGLPIGVAADGTATVLVIDGDGKSLRAYSRPPGGTFGAPRLLTAVPANKVTTPALAVGPSGEAVAAWRDSADGGTTWTPRAAVRDIGGWNQSGAIGPAGAIAADVLSRDPITATINGGGRAAVGFGAPVAGTVRAHLALRAAGSLSVANGVVLSTVAEGRVVRVAITPKGIVLAAFHEIVEPNKNARVIWRIAVASGELGAARILVTADDDNATMLSVVAGPGEQFSAVWHSVVKGRVSYINVPDGGVISQRPLSPVGTLSVLPSLSVDPAGNRLVIWSNFSNVGVQSVYRAAGDADFSEPRTIDAPGDGQRIGLATAPDGRGNHVVAWARQQVDGQTPIELAAFDDEAPVLSGDAIPTSAIATVQAPFAITATDTWSTPTVSWAFGDGVTASGGAVEHAYAAASSPTVAVEATDGAGNKAGLSRGVTVAPHPGIDADGDGYLAGRDCNDSDPAVHPGARDKPGNKIDENCDAVDAGFRTIDASVTLGWKPGSRNRLRVQKFDVVGVREGDRVKLRCSGKGCKRSANVTKRVKQVRRNTLVLSDRVKQLSLARGATLTVSIARDDFSTKVVTYTVKNGRSLPKKDTHCLVPDTKRTTPCA